MQNHSFNQALQAHTQPQMIWDFSQIAEKQNSQVCDASLLGTMQPLTQHLAHQIQYNNQQGQSINMRQLPQLCQGSEILSQNYKSLIYQDRQQNPTHFEAKMLHLNQIMLPSLSYINNPDKYQQLTPLKPNIGFHEQVASEHTQQQQQLNFSPTSQFSNSTYENSLQMIHLNAKSLENTALSQQQQLQRIQPNYFDSKPINFTYLSKNQVNKALLSDSNIQQKSICATQDSQNQQYQLKIESIISECRLLELMMSVEHISDEDHIIIPGQVRFKSQTVRGSKYRGVSKNGNKWQVLVMGNQKKQYSGSIKDELMAAKMYDKFAIKNLGLRAKTNFDYKKKDIQKIIRDLQEDDTHVDQ